MQIPDGALTRGRDVREHLSLTCDVCVIGSGAGGATAAAVFAAAGKSVVVLEAGGAYDKSRFTMIERDVYPILYQEGLRRATADLSISILQGRALGGGTVVNWTTSFRTPETVLAHWRARYGLSALTEAALKPHFEAMEGRLGIHDVPYAHVNANNRVLWDGAGVLGWHRALLRRNTRACRLSGYCGLGCPVDAKQGAHLTTLPDAAHDGARIFSDCDVRRLVLRDGRVARVEARFHHPEDGDAPTGGTLTVEPQLCVLAGGAINSPALLLRSEAPNSNRRLGKRTWLHPVVATVARFKGAIDPFYGAPQSVSSHQFAHRDDGMGYFIEAAPLHPVVFATAVSGHGALHREAMTSLSHINSLLAIHLDGFTDDELGGTVSLWDDGAPRLDYKATDAFWESTRHAMRSLARIQLAAGAREVLTGHEEVVSITRPEDLDRIDAAPVGPNRVRIFSAHQMGGCAMGADPQESVVDADLRHHELANLYIMDGSVFPTSLGVNPQLTIYGVVHRAASNLANRGR